MIVVLMRMMTVVVSVALLMNMIMPVIVIMIADMVMIMAMIAVLSVLMSVLVDMLKRMLVIMILFRLSPSDLGPKCDATKTHQSQQGEPTEQHPQIELGRQDVELVEQI